MKPIISKAMMLVALAAAVFSFTSKFGGEGFEISLNGKLLLQQFGKDINLVKTGQLSHGSANDQLTVKYYHCGTVSKKRILTIKDAQDKILREWHFSYAGSSQMNCYVRDIVGLKKNNSTVLKLYYSSSDLPAGRMLVSISRGSAVAVNK